MGLGRSFYRRALCAPVGVLVVALLAPPPTHNHGAHPARFVSYLAHRCSADGRAPHLHPARTLPAPRCPACAAGPAASGTPAHAPVEADADGCARVPAVTSRVCAPWAGPGCVARAPPRFLLDI